MDFRLTEDQVMLRDTVRRIAVDQFGPRAAEIDENETFSQENFKILAFFALREYKGFDL